MINPLPAFVVIMQPIGRQPGELRIIVIGGRFASDRLPGELMDRPNSRTPKAAPARIRRQFATRVWPLQESMG